MVDNLVNIWADQVSMVPEVVTTRRIDNLDPMTDVTAKCRNQDVYDGKAGSQVQQ